MKKNEKTKRKLKYAGVTFETNAWCKKLITFKTQKYFS